MRMLDTNGRLGFMAAHGLALKKGFKGLAAPRGATFTGAEDFLKADLSSGMPLSRQCRRAFAQSQAKLNNRAKTIYMRALKRFPDASPYGDPKVQAKVQAKVLAKRKGFADMLLATGAKRLAHRAALGHF